MHSTDSECIFKIYIGFYINKYGRNYVRVHQRSIFFADVYLSPFTVLRDRFSNRINNLTGRFVMGDELCLPAE